MSRPTNPFDLTSPQFIADPYPIYHRLQSDSPVCWDEKLNSWLVTSYNDVHGLLRDRRFSSNQLDDMMGRLAPEEQAAAAPLRAILTHRLVLTDSPTHNRLRSLMQLAFTPRRVEMMGLIIEAIIDDLLANVRSPGRMDLIADFADPMPGRTIAAMLGLLGKDRERFKGWTDDIYGFFGFSATPVGERARRGAASAVNLRQYLGELFARIRRQPRDDLLSAMLAAEEQGDRLTETELFSNVVGLINASHETTTNLIGNTIYTLLRHPDQWRRLTEEANLVNGTVEEGLRYESPVQILLRKAADVVVVSGVTIPKGEAVLVGIGAANRDPGVFTDPDRFDVTRSEDKHLAFGGGPHFCLGAALGRLEGQIAIDALRKRLPTMRLASEPVSWRTHPVFRGLKSLPVEF